MGQNGSEPRVERRLAAILAADVRRLDSFELDSAIASVAPPPARISVARAHLPNRV
jgi:hypothetical protein